MVFSESQGTESNASIVAGSGGDQQAIQPPDNPWVPGMYFNLKPRLHRRHIVMISLSGTIGMGLFISAGQIILLSGSAGAFLSYFVTGLIAICVMDSISEMVALIPEAGALQEYPRRFVDPALGWAVAGTYWFSYAMGVPNLATSTAILATGFKPDVNVGWIITGILVVVVLINILGIKLYGEIEYVGGFLKIVLAVGLIILMLILNRGGGPKGTVYGIEYWKKDFRFTPQTLHESGSLGHFLSVWKGMTIAAFSYVGVEIVAVTASEAKYPRADLPGAARWVCLLTIGLYAAAVFFVSLNVPHTDHTLHNLEYEQPITGSFSPFVIAIEQAGIDVLPGFISGAFLFASWSTCLTSMFVASRTLYGMATRLSPTDYPWLSRLGRTTPNGVPVMAILASSILSPLAYLQCGGTDPRRLLSIFSQVETVGCLLVWMSECIAFIRFYYGLRIEGASHNRMSDDYPYRSWGQPWTACVGCVGTAMLVLFNGFDVFITKEGGFQPKDFSKDFFSAYLALFAFIALYLGIKIGKGTKVIPYPLMDYSVQREDFDRVQDPEKGGLVKVLKRIGLF